MTEFNQTSTSGNEGSSNQGSVANAIAGNYSFSIEGILKAAWAKMDGHKGTIWMGILIYFLIAIPFGIISGIAGDNAIFFNLVLQIIQTIVFLPLGMGLYFIGIKIVTGNPTTGKEVLNYFPHTLNLFLTYLLMALCIFVGFLLLILPGIYLAVAYQMAMPLVVDKKMSPWEAMETSRKAITHQWFKYFGLLLVVAIIVIISAIPLGIGLAWTVPLVTITYAMLYVKMFGFNNTQNEANNTSNTSV